METNIDKHELKVWPDSVIKAYIQIMVDEVTKGNMQNGVFNSKIWNSIKDRLNSITNRSFTVKQIKQKYNRLRSKHREFSLLLQHTGFGWDAETNTVTASEEVWQSYIRAHSEAAQFQKKGCEHYKLLGIIFNRSTATGVLHHSSTQDPPNTDEEQELENQYLNNGVHVDLDGDSSNDDIQTIEYNTHGRKRKIQVRERKSHKESKTYQMGDALKAWAEASKARAEESLAKAEKHRATPSVDYSIAKCVIALDEIKDVANDIYLKALQKFMEPSWREVFLTMSTDRRKIWLNSLD